MAFSDLFTINFVLQDKSVSKEQQEQKKNDEDFGRRPDSIFDI